LAFLGGRGTNDELLERRNASQQIAFPGRIGAVDDARSQYAFDVWLLATFAGSSLPVLAVSVSVCRSRTER